MFNTYRKLYVKPDEPQLYFDLPRNANEWDVKISDILSDDGISVSVKSVLDVLPEGYEENIELFRIQNGIDEAFEVFIRHANVHRRNCLLRRAYDHKYAKYLEDMEIYKQTMREERYKCYLELKEEFENE